MQKILDDWFIQNDIKDIIDSHDRFSDKWTLLYQITDSALEHFVYCSIPIASKKINRIMNYETWGTDFSLTTKKILLLKENNFFSLSFRRFFDIHLYSNKYLSESNVIYGKLEEKESFGIKSKKCYVLTEALIEYLQSTNQTLLFGIRSHRHSERTLNEFELKKLGVQYRSNRKNYSFHVQPIINHDSIYHNQIKSMSIIFGKYYVQNV